MPRIIHAWPALVVAALGLLTCAGPARAIEPGLLPPDTEAVLTINLRQLLKSDLAKAHPDVVAQLKATVEGHLADFMVQRYFEKMDLDPFRDLDRVTVTTTGGKMPDFILVEGKFNPEKVQAAAEAAASENDEHLKLIKIAGLNAYEVRIDPNESPVYAGLVGTDKFIATHTKDEFAEAVTRIRNKGGNNASKLKKELREVLAVSGDKTSLTAVSTGGALVKLAEEAPVPDDQRTMLGDVLKNIAALNVSLTLAKDFDFELVINCKDKKSADEMVGLANLGLAGAKLMLKQKVDSDAKLAPALDIVSSMRVTSEQNNLVLRGAITAQILGKILKDLPRQ
jgi:hypothetical protein